MERWKREEASLGEAACCQLAALVAVRRAGAVGAQEAASLQLGADGGSAADGLTSGAHGRRQRTRASRPVKLAVLTWKTPAVLRPRRGAQVEGEGLCYLLRPFRGPAAGSVPPCTAPAQRVSAGQARAEGMSESGRTSGASLCRTGPSNTGTNRGSCVGGNGRGCSSL